MTSLASHLNDAFADVFGNSRGLPTSQQLVRAHGYLTVTDQPDWVRFDVTGYLEQADDDILLALSREHFRQGASRTSPFDASDPMACWSTGVDIYGDAVESAARWSRRRNPDLDETLERVHEHRAVKCSAALDRDSVLAWMRSERRHLLAQLPQLD